MRMTHIDVGSAVCPKNGRYAGRLMAVISIRDGYAEVCDGKRRRIEHPKRKKLCHLSLFSPDSPRLRVDAELTDGAVRRYLAAVKTGTTIPDKYLNTIQ